MIFFGELDQLSSNSCIIPTVENLWGGIFLFPPEPLLVNLLNILHFKSFPMSDFINI